MLVLALHGAYVVSLMTGWLSGRQQMQLALAAYATYLVNASQFLIKLRAARREKPLTVAAPSALGAHQ
jgi:3-vinyl bacteriochlorophyllide hydratase